MGRPIAFDQEAALTEAMYLFWEKGYDATHISDLLAAMNISRSTLYASFGDKDELFKRVLAHYKKRGRVKRDVLLQERNTKKALQLFFDRHINQCYANDVPKSCIITNSATLIGHVDPTIEDTLIQDFNELAEVFQEVIIRGKQNGEMAQQTDPQLGAYTLLSLNHSINIMSTYRKDKALAVQLVRKTIEAL